MRLRLLLLAVALSGCASVPVDDVEVENVGVSAGTLYPRALDLARGWHPDAQTWGVATFEVDWSQESNRMARHYDGEGLPGDGLAHVWTFAFRAQSAGLLGGYGPYFVIHLDDTGDVLSAYETTDDDEGAMGQAPMTAWDVDSHTAAALATAANPEYELLRNQEATGLAVLQMVDIGGAMSPVWTLTLHGETSATVWVDAQDGRVLDSQAETV